MFALNIITVLIAAGFMANAERATVETTHGRVEGKVLKTLFGKEYYGFMGIPFAKPPVGELRFLPPQPIEPWEGILKATKEKQACVQYNTNIKKGQRLGVYGSEDCLYLDIFTPDLDQNKRSVIVFVYNENFAISYNKTKDYAPDFFIEEDIVMVTISHRLSVFGFLSLEDEIVTGNAGLKDIVESLKWVKHNIYQFGGDSNKITLMGVQGGAAAVDLLVHSSARELFSSAILQSGSSLSTSCLQEGARKRAFKLGEILKFSTSSATNLLTFLRDKDTTPVNLLKKDIHATPKDYFKENQRAITAFGPIVEKQKDGLITAYPEESTEKINIPIMIGFNSREGLESSFTYLIEPQYLTYVDRDFPLMMPIRLNLKLDPVEEKFYEAIDDIKSFYFQGKVGIKNVPNYISYIGDVAIAYNVDYAAKAYSTKSDAVYYYHFDYYCELNENKNNILKLSTVGDGTWGAASGDELCYLFKCPNLKEAYLKHHKSASEEYIIQSKMVRMWANFAKYGNPTPEGDDLLNGLKWPTYNTETQQYLHIDNALGVKTNVYKERFQFWDEFIRKWDENSKTNKATEESININEEL